MKLGMKRLNLAIFGTILIPFAAMAANEGTPVYYQTQKTNANQANYGAYAQQGYTNYVGQSGQKQVVGTRSYTYQTERPVIPTITGTMTPNGIAMPVADEPSTKFFADYARRFADFNFKTGVNSILEWDNMIFNEITVGAEHTFNIRNFDLMVYGKYTYGDMASGGWSVDYDLEPYDPSYPDYGIFTISVGDMSGDTNHLRFGIGAKHVWDIGGWKLTPSIGYEIFKHNLEMSDHIYPNPGIYLPLMTENGQYVFGNANGDYFALGINDTPPEDWYQVCMSPEDIKVISEAGIGPGGQLPSLVPGDYNDGMGDIPWGVGPGECVIIGGDGAIRIPGTTHIYNTTWSGIYFGLELEKQMTLSDKLRFYVQFGLPNYKSEGIWPNRTDWQQNPSFIDEGSNGAYSYLAEMEYNMKLSDRLQLALKVDTNLFYVGKIGGELYVAEYSTWLIDEYGQYVLDEFGLPILETYSAHTEKISESLKHAQWQSFGIHLGLKYSF
ncbi:hypothetical protein LJC18_04320 [Lachnospiraceae bacterium OttesenSCG-928-E19]|nr:hypothetical protein [Lachnospiraceae bacterium OttesenSCG-928-E19]